MVHTVKWSKTLTVDLLTTVRVFCQAKVQQGPKILNTVQEILKMWLLPYLHDTYCLKITWHIHIQDFQNWYFTLQGQFQSTRGKTTLQRLSIFINITTFFVCLYLRAESVTKCIQIKYFYCMVSQSYRTSQITVKIFI